MIQNTDNMDCVHESAGLSEPGWISGINKVATRFITGTGYTLECSIHILLLTGCGMAVESPVKVCALALAPDLKRTARTIVQWINE